MTKATKPSRPWRTTTPKLECYVLLHTDKGKFWIAATDVQRVDACHLPDVLTRPSGSYAAEQAPPRRRLWSLGLVVGLAVFLGTVEASPTWTLIATFPRG